MEIAIYGKGGIGKTTLSANLSAALAGKGKKVLQIGCDPKHDSTRLLMQGRYIKTVLDYIRETGPLDYKEEDVLFKGFRDIGCVEAGGPEPGVGCAGRGIITMFELLERFKIKTRYDMVVYDVLGDVVCGGFAVPIRREYAEIIFIVTSGEYMAIYAANNILRGVKNYDNDKCRVAGILYNSRNVEDEDKKVMAFAKAVGLPICAKIPRSHVFARAEKENCTVIEMLEGKGKGESDMEQESVADIFKKLAGEISSGMEELYTASPLDDAELERVVLGAVKNKLPVRLQDVADVTGAVDTTADCKETVKDVQEKSAKLENAYLSKNVLRREPLHGCAFNGAVNMSIHIRDAVVLAHAPKSCSYLSFQSISSAGRRRLFERGALLPVSISPHFEATDMDETDMIFGGMEKLVVAVEKIKGRVKKPKAVIVVSACPTGIIGDDIDAVKDLSDDDMPILTLKADGNLAGDYLQGMLMSYTELARQIVKKDRPLIDNTVNIVFEKVVAKNAESNFLLMQKYLNAMGISVNCRFLCSTDFLSIENFCTAPLNLLAYKDYTGNILEKFFKTEYGCTFYEKQFPVGFSEMGNWLCGVGDFFGKKEIAKGLIDESLKEYKTRIATVFPHLRGKKLMIITYNHDLDWILEAALDAGMELVKICVMNYSQDEGFRSDLAKINEKRELLIAMNYNSDNKEKDIAKYQPDVLLSNYESAVAYKNCITDTIPFCPDMGFFSGCILVERWKNMIDFDLKGDWKKDDQLFKKYYAG